jgi:hypothetical protein
VLAREIHYEPLPPEVRTIVIAAWTRGGLLSAATGERMVPVEPEATEFLGKRGAGLNKAY